jgi:beta-xylosidase
VTIPNPLLPGFNPDPSVCRVGEDYYLATSTFEYLPGIALYHSRDFATWRQIGNVATRPGQLAVAAVATGGGAWAPTIRHRDGVFYLVITDAFGRGTLLFTATDPAGPWSDGLVFDGIDGIDPDLAWDDDGQAVMTFSGLGVNPALPTFMQHRGLLQAKVDLSTATALEAPRSVWSGVGGQFPEAPHLYHIGQWWYLVIAEGGTERGHSVSVARGPSPAGPFEAAPGTPLLTARGTNRPVQCTGHGDLVQLADGSWRLVLLGVRPRQGAAGFSALGRETFSVPVTWSDDGWPVFEPVPLDPRPGEAAWREDFDGAALGPEWLAVRRLPAELPGAGLAGRASWLELAGDGSTLSDLVPVFLGRRQLNQTATVKALLDVSAGVGGLAVRYDEKFHYAIAAGGGQVTATAHVGDIEQVVSRPWAGDPRAVELEIASRPPEGGFTPSSDQVELAAWAGAERHVIAAFDGRFLSCEVAHSFTGRVVGVFAQQGQVAVDYVDYRGNND